MPKKNANARSVVTRGVRHGGGGSSGGPGYGDVPARLHAKYLQHAPQRRSTKSGIVLRNTEFVEDVVVTSSAFELKRYAVQPNNDSYQYLQQVSKDFDFYRVLEWEYHFVPRLGTDTNGVTFMVPEYDPQDPAPIDARSAMIVPGATSESAPWPNHCKLSTKALNNFIAPGGHGYAVASLNDGLAQGGDIRLIDAGAFYMCTQGISGTKPLTAGTLYLSYAVELSIPNSDSRLVSDGTYNKPITQPGNLLPAVSRLYGNLGAQTPLIANLPSNYFANVNMEAMANAFSESLDYRNIMQYWDAASSVFKMPAGRWLLNAVLPLELTPAGTPSDVETTLIVDQSRDGGTTWNQIAAQAEEHVTTPGSLSIEGSGVGTLVSTVADDLIRIMAKYSVTSGPAIQVVPWQESSGSMTPGPTIEMTQLGLGTF